MDDLIKTNWTGGINQFSDPSAVNFETEYYLGINVRVRNNVVTPILGPADVKAGLPDAVVQGAYGLGNFLIAFVAGKAYYKDYSGTTPRWIQVTGGLQMTVTGRIYAEQVPTSTVNYIRSAVDGNNYKAGVKLSGTRNSTPAGFIIMDGTNQPWIIFADGSARVTQNFAQWSSSSPEYVPTKVKYPFYFDGILYCVGADANGVYNQILRSVTDRPLDFMVPVSVSGDKITNVETESGAQQVAYRVDFNEVTYIGAIATVDNGFMVCTNKASYIILPDYVNTIFSEPTFSNQFLFSVGAVNDQSVSDVLGDTTVINYRGIRSFNGVGVAKFDGKNAPFNIKINSLIEGIIQSQVAVTNFDNYVVYALQTKYGYGLLWYDTLLAAWVSLDIYPETSAIVQFATVVVGAVNKLFYYTASGGFFEALAGRTLAPTLYLGEILPYTVTKYGNKVLAMQHSISSVQLMLSNGTTPGVGEVSIYGDRIRIDTRNKILNKTEVSGEGLVEAVPYQPATTSNTQAPMFDFSSTDQVCVRAGALISWDNDATLRSLRITRDVVNNPTAYQVDPADATTETVHKKVILLGNDGSLSADRVAVNNAIQAENADAIISLGNLAPSPTDTTNIATYLTPFWDNLHELGTFFAIPSTNELDASSGEPFYSYIRQSANRRTVQIVGSVAFYLFPAGFDSSKTQVDPLNQDGADYESSSHCTWLRNEIANSTAKIHVLCIANPPRSSTTDYASTTPQPGRTILDAVDWAGIGVNVVCSGLVNGYERLHNTNGLLYLVAGTGGIGEGVFRASPEEGSAARFSQYGYIRLSITSLSVKIEFVGSDGTVLDTYFVRAN